jgi:hypothetical protein
MNKVSSVESSRLVVTYRPVGDLIPDPSNARTHPKRRFRGLDIDPAYVDVAIERWSARTGLESRLEGPVS